MLLHAILFCYFPQRRNHHSPRMSPTPQVGGVDVDGYVFPPAVRAPGGGCSQLFLGGAGVRGLEIGGNFVKFTAIAIYLEDGAVSSLAGKWRGKSVQELAASLDFFGDIFTGPFEKFTHVRMILPLTGQQYSEKVVENCVAHWKSIGSYSDAEAKAVKEFLHVFRDQNFPPGSSILFTHSPHGSLSISFTKDETLPKAPDAAIANKQLSEAVLESIIGKDGVSPAAKQSLAVRMSEIFKAKESCKEDAASAVKDTTKYDTEKLSAEKMPVENLS